MAFRYIIGIDEVGRGPLAGPLCVGAFLVPLTKTLVTRKKLAGIKDSKQLTPAKRAIWFRTLTLAMRDGQCRFCTVFVGEKVIDARGLSYALRYAIARTLKKLNADPKTSKILLDGGIFAPRQFLRQCTIIKGDEKEPLIAGASIVAKVRRDRYMIKLGKRYPQYGFEIHKGYGTKAHYEAIRRYGPCRIHRVSFLKSLYSKKT